MLKTIKNFVRPFVNEFKENKRNRYRQKLFQKDWNHDGEFSTRVYSDYGSYLEHQASKLELMQDHLNKNYENFYKQFYTRFLHTKELEKCETVLCLGARNGVEVEALIELGKFAVGVDLNPGQGNKYVVTGDFHSLVFADKSVDAVYTNCLDHAFDLEKIINEIKRVLTSKGFFITDICLGRNEGFMPGGFESLSWKTADELINKIQTLGMKLLHSSVNKDTRYPEKGAVFQVSN